MFLTIDVGNTHSDVGYATSKRVQRRLRLESTAWKDGTVEAHLRQWVGSRTLVGASVASVVPELNDRLIRMVRDAFGVETVFLSHRNVVGLGIEYPRPKTIGADRLANAMAAVVHYGNPVVVVDFGTAVTFDVVDSKRNYVGGIIAPGLSAMTDYLHEKTALLPKVQLRNPRRVIGKSTQEAMLIGTVKGYRGLISGLLRELRSELGVRRLKVLATGGYADLVARDLPEVSDVDSGLTLEGLRLLAVDCFQPGPEGAS